MDRRNQRSRRQLWRVSFRTTICKVAEETVALRQQLIVAQQEAKEAQNLAYAMQAQVSAFMQYQQMAVGSMAPMDLPAGATPEAFSPQRPKAPLQRDARAPFGVVRSMKETKSSPYGRPAQHGEPPGEDGGGSDGHNNIRQLD